MADEASNDPGPFDVRTIKNLVALMSRHDLSEIYLQEGEQRIRLRRGPHGVVSATPVVHAAAPAVPPPAAAPTPSPVPSAAAGQEGDGSTKGLHLIKSTTPGTFYARPKPDAEPYVQVGARITPTTVVCQIEAMKIFNEIMAECSGVIREVLVENQQPVEYGQALFKVDTTA